MALVPIISGMFVNLPDSSGGGGGLTIETITAAGDRNITSADVGKFLALATSGTAINLKLQTLVVTPGFSPGDVIEFADVTTGPPSTLEGIGIAWMSGKSGAFGTVGPITLEQAVKYTLTFLGDLGSGNTWQLDYAPTQPAQTVASNPSQALTTTLTPDTSNSISLNGNTGKWLITGYAHIKFNGATFPANRILSVALWDDLVGGAILILEAYTPIITTQSYSMGIYPINYVVDTDGVTAGMTLSVAAGISALPSAGTITLENWGLQATKLQ